MSYITYNNIKFYRLQTGRYQSKEQGDINTYTWKHLIGKIPKGQYVISKVKGNYDIINLYLATSPKQPTTYILYYNNYKIRIVNLSRYCRNHPDLKLKGMEKLVQGVIKSYKGYTLQSTKVKLKPLLKKRGPKTPQSNGSYDHTIYEFYHEDEGIHLLTQYDLRHKFELTKCCVSALTLGNSKSVKGWSII